MGVFFGNLLGGLVRPIRVKRWPEGHLNHGPPGADQREAHWQQRFPLNSFNRLRSASLFI